MKSKFLVLFICLLATIAMVGCDIFGSDDDDDVISGSYGTIVGNILKDDGGAISSKVTVSGGGKSADTTTGAFTLENVNIDANGKVFLTIEGSGYINTYAVEGLNAGQKAIATYTIRAIPAGATQSYSNLKTEAKAVQPIVGKAKIDIVASSILGADDKAVDSAEITVVHTMPKTDAKALDTFPGIFAGVPTGGITEVPFETFGFVYVDLGTGNKLDPSKPATLTMPIDPAMLAEADETIPLWSYDTTKGQWIQEGEANRADADGTKNPAGNFYVAYPIEHFSWYNLDRPFGNDVRTLNVTVASYTYTFSHHDMDTEGTATTDTNKTDMTKRVANARVEVIATLDNDATDEDNGFTTTDTTRTATWKEVRSTNTQGEVTFSIPSGRRIAIKVTAPDGTTQDGYGYQVENSVASAFINMNKGGYVD